MSNTLPNNWAISTLGEISLPSQYGFTAKALPVGNTHYLRTTDITPGSIDWNSIPFCDVSIDDLKKFQLYDGDILISRAGSVGYSILIENPRTSVFASYLIRFRPLINSKYFAYYLNTPQYWSLVNQESSGIAVQNLNASKISNFTIPIAPINEQKRIVSKIDTLFSELDNGIKELEEAKKKLELYRQSLLKSAVEGKLSKKWRETKTEIYETGEQLLVRILKERRECWEQEKLKEFTEKEKNLPKNWQEKYPEPVQPDTENLPQLPEGWVWASLDMLGEIVSGVTKGTKRANSVPTREVSYLRVANVQRGYLDLTEIKKILATEKDILQLTLKEGDILFNEGGDRDKLGRGWVWKSEIKECIHQNHVFRCRLYEPNFIPELISYHGNTFGKLWFERAGKQTTNLASINMGVLKRFPVPVIPILEQKFIFDYIESNLGTVDLQLEQNSELTKYCYRQRTNILTQAFQGKLVAQDPNDEPAQTLLEWVQKEREAKASALKATPKKRTIRKLKKEVSMSKSILDILKQQSDWISGQDLAATFGLNEHSEIEEIEQFYEQLRTLSLDDKIMVKPDQQNNKKQDLIKLKDIINAS